MSTFLAPFTSPTPLLDAAPAVDDDYDLSSLLAVLMHEDFATPPPAVDDDYDLSSLLAVLMHDDVADDTLPAAFFVHGDDHHAAMLLPPAAQVLDPPAMSHSRKRGFFPAYDEAAAGSSRSAARRRLQQSSPSSSPPHRGGGRRVWVRERSTEWWDRLSGPACPEAEFRRAFRMSRATFDKLCNDLGAAVAKEDTALRSAIPVRQRVAVCLWRLATGEPLREVSGRFGLGISTCHNIVVQVCAALTTVLLPTAVRWPDSPAAIASRFEVASGIPGVVGVVYTEHIPIVTPKENVGDYYNRRLTERNQKASYSVAVQAVVDADGAFTDVCIGPPGSLPDAAVLERSTLHARCEAGLLRHGHDQRLLGGASYPLTDWMLVPYTHHNLTWAQHAFNERVDAALGAARGAFGRLKARWRCLQRRTEAKLPADLHNMLSACCVLHNLCERNGEGLDPDLQYDLFQDDDVVAADAVRSAAAEEERDRIAHGLLYGGDGCGCPDPNPTGNYPEWDEGLAGTDATAGGEGFDYEDQGKMGAIFGTWGE